ncbi:MAG: FAD-dependent oxidoreductase [Mycoplasmatales bacterium]
MKKIVIIGGGYAGVLTSKKLHKMLKKEIKNGEVDITLIDKKPYHTLLTELHEITFDRTQTDAVKIYLQKILRTYRINVCIDEVTSVDYDKGIVHGKTQDYDYDYIVEATGSTPAYFGIDGAEEFAYPMWSVIQGLEVRKVIIDNFNKAEVCLDPEERKKLLTFVVAGAGFTGVEVVGELQEWIECTLIKQYVSIDIDEVKIYCIDGAPRILNAFSEKAAGIAHRYMVKKGIEIITESYITKITPDEVHYGDGNVVKTSCCIWTSGIQGNPVTLEDENLLRNMRVQVNQDLTRIGHDNAYILGDLSFMVPKSSEIPLPQMVENCEAAAPVVAKNIVSKIRGTGKNLEYDPTFHGAMACIGGRYGVAELHFAGKKLILTSFFAMAVKHMINLVYLVQAAGVTQVWTYIKHEFFHVKDRRSFVGGLLSAQSPSIYLVPLRIWLGFYWVQQGAPKVIKKLQGGWEAICSNTEMVPLQLKQFGDICIKNAPEGYKALQQKQAAAAAPPVVTPVAEATAPVAPAVTDATTGATDAAAGAGSALPDAAAGAGSALPDAAAGAGAATDQSQGILDSILGFFDFIKPESTPFGLAYDFTWLPDRLEDFINWMLTLSLGAMAPYEWLVNFIMDFIELGTGLLLIIGFAVPLVSLGTFILSIVISMGSYFNFGGVVVEGLLFSIFSSFALMTFGGNDHMPLSVDYFMHKKYVNWIYKDPSKAMKPKYPNTRLKK